MKMYKLFATGTNGLGVQCVSVGQILRFSVNGDEEVCEEEEKRGLLFELSSG